MSCGVDYRHSSDLVVLWLCHRLAATAPIQPLAWDRPYAVGGALKNTKKERKKKANGRAGWINCEMLSKVLINDGSCPFLVLWKEEEKGEPSARDQKASPCIELVMSGEELRNLLQEISQQGNFFFFFFSNSLKKFFIIVDLQCSVHFCYTAK